MRLCEYKIHIIIEDIYICDNRVEQSFGEDCNKTINLENIENIEEFLMNDDIKKMFFLETSRRQFLTPRESCALESAASVSDLQVVVMMTSSVLNLHQNSTCHLYQSSNNIK